MPLEKGLVAFGKGPPVPLGKGTLCPWEKALSCTNGLQEAEGMGT